MLAVYDTSATRPPCPTPFNMAAHVLAQADAQPDKTALAILGLSEAEYWSYAQLKYAVLGTARGLIEYGLNSGDKYLIRMGNTVDTPISYLAAIAVGLIPIPTSSQLTEEEISNLCKQLAPALILHDPALSCPTGHAPILTVQELRTMRDLPPAEFAMGDPNRPAYIVCTSGTSGQPRAVLHAHRAIWARQMMIRDWYDLKPSDRLCHAGAFNWTYTMGTGLMDPWSVGATAFIPQPDITPEQLPMLLKQYDVSVFAAAPGVYRKVLNSETTLDLPNLRHGLSAGEKLSSSIHNKWRTATGTELYEAYGMSECSTPISSCPDHVAP